MWQAGSPGAWQPAGQFAGPAGWWPCAATVSVLFTPAGVPWAALGWAGFGCVEVLVLVSLRH